MKIYSNFLNPVFLLGAMSLALTSYPGMAMEDKEKEEVGTKRKRPPEDNEKTEQKKKQKTEEKKKKEEAGRKRKRSPEDGEANEPQKKQKKKLQNKSSSSSLLILPDELWVKIFGYLAYGNFFSLASTCKDLRNISQDKSLRISEEDIPTQLKTWIKDETPFYNIGWLIHHSFKGEEARMLYNEARKALNTSIFSNVSPGQKYIKEEELKEWQPYGLALFLASSLGHQEAIALRKELATSNSDLLSKSFFHIHFLHNEYSNLSTLKDFLSVQEGSALTWRLGPFQARFALKQRAYEEVKYFQAYFCKKEDSGLTPSYKFPGYETEKNLFEAGNKKLTSFEDILKWRREEVKFYERAIQLLEKEIAKIDQIIQQKEQECFYTGDFDMPGPPEKVREIEEYAEKHKVYKKELAARWLSMANACSAIAASIREDIEQTQWYVKAAEMFERLVQYIEKDGTINDDGRSQALSSAAITFTQAAWRSDDRAQRYQWYVKAAEMYETRILSLKTKATLGDYKKVQEAYISASNASKDNTERANFYVKIGELYEKRIVSLEEKGSLTEYADATWAYRTAANIATDTSQIVKCLEKAREVLEKEIQSLGDNKDAAYYGKVAKIYDESATYNVDETERITLYIKAGEMYEERIACLKREVTASDYRDAELAYRKVTCLSKDRSQIATYLTKASSFLEKRIRRLDDNNKDVAYYRKVADIYNDSASYTRDKTEKAKLCKIAAEMYETRISGLEDKATSDDYNNVANTYLEVARASQDNKEKVLWYKKARKAFDIVTKLKNQALKPENQKAAEDYEDVAISYENVGFCYFKAAKFSDKQSEKVEWYEKAGEAYDQCRKYIRNNAKSKNYKNAAHSYVEAAKCSNDNDKKATLYEKAADGYAELGEYYKKSYVKFNEYFRKCQEGGEISSTEERDENEEIIADTCKKATMAYEEAAKCYEDAANCSTDDSKKESLSGNAKNMHQLVRVSS